MTVYTTNSWMHDRGCDRKALERELRAGTLVRLRRGVVMPAEDLAVWQLHRRRIEATALKINRGTFFALQSAALLHGLPVRITTSLPVQVIRTMGGQHTRNRLIQAAPAALQPDETVVIDGLPATSLVRTVADLARRLPFPDAVAVVDAALRRNVTKAALATPTGFGRARARMAVDFGDAASESYGESYSRAVLRLANIPRPQLQVAQYDEQGSFLGRPDFDWGGRVVGEYDGTGKYDGSYGVDPATAIRAEKLREQRLIDNGYTVVRWQWSEILVPGLVPDRIRRALANRTF